MSKHTQGPWKVVSIGLTDAVTCGDVGIETRSGQIGIEFEGRLWVEREECEANACLIAAAPELLEALERMLEAFPPPKMARGEGFAGNLAHATARTAIAKAKGGAK